MASISSSAAPAGTGATGAAGSTGAAGATPGGTPEGSNSFTQLISGMITAAEPSAAAPGLQDLSDVALEALEGLGDTDADPEDLDDDEDAALAIASLLPGLSLLAPLTQAAAGANAGDGAATALANAIAANVGSDSSQAAIEALLAEAGSAAADAAEPATTDGADNPVSTATMHGVLPTHGSRPPDAPADGVMRSPVGTPAWNDELGAQLTWMAANGREAASLRLSPDHLGPLEIRISVRDGEASVWFGAANPDTRSALEQSLPRLRELFAAQGLVLADAGVSREGPRHAFKPTATAFGSRGSSDASPDTSVTSVTLSRVGMIDTYV